jgi:hypothetical protein
MAWGQVLAIEVIGHHAQPGTGQRKSVVIDQSSFDRASRQESDDQGFFALDDVVIDDD